MKRKIWITSDTHFNHANIIFNNRGRSCIIRYCNRPFGSIKEMNDKLIENWNRKVRKEDIVIHLGDFARNGISYFRRKLNGTIIIVQGNHDERHINELKENGFIIVDKLQIGNLLFTHEPLNREDIPLGLTNVHGHIHEKDSLNGINVSVEKTNYEPILLV